MTVDIKAAVELAKRIDAGEHQGDRSTYYSAMLVLSQALLALAPVVEAAQTWRASSMGGWDRTRETFLRALDALNGGK